MCLVGRLPQWSIYYRADTYSCLTRQYSKQRKDYPRTSFIFIYHTTKEGRFRGENAHAHEVDVIVQVENGLAKAKGKFGGGELQVIY